MDFTIEELMAMYECGYAVEINDGQIKGFVTEDND